MDNEKKILDPNEAVEAFVDEAEDEDIIELTDEDGVTSEFQHLATLEHEGKDYVVLMALSDEEGEEENEEEGDDAEVLILGIEQDENGEDIYVSCDDDEISQQVFDKFLKLLDEEEE